MAIVLKEKNGIILLLQKGCRESMQIDAALLLYKKRRLPEQSQFL